MKKESNYISMSESRKIRKYNIKQMRYYEKQKRRKCSEDEYITTMRDENNVVEIDNLETCFFTDNGTVTSVHGVSFDIPKNKIVGVVGESGCGKSVTSLSIMQLVQAPQGQIVGGSIRFNTDQLGYDENGNLTTDPEAIQKSKRPLPIGYWKGSALSLALDMIASATALGRTTAMVAADSHTE